MPVRPTPPAADSYLDVPRVWPSNAEALTVRPAALDAVEAEYRSARRLAVGGAGVLLLTGAVVSGWLGLAVAFGGTDPNAREGVVVGAIAVVAALLAWWGTRLGRRALRAGRRTMNALAYWYTLPTTLTEDGGRIPAELLSQTDSRGALLNRTQPRAIARGAACFASCTLTFLLVLTVIGVVATGEPGEAGYTVATVIAGIVLAVLFGSVAVALLRSVRRAGRLRSVRVLLASALVDEVDELPAELGHVAAVVYAVSKAGGISPPPIRVGHTTGDFKAIAYQTLDGPHIVVDDTLLQAPVEVQQLVAAHETAHVVLGHAERLPHGLRVRLRWHALGTTAVLMGWSVLFFAADIPPVVPVLLAIAFAVGWRFTRAAITAPYRRPQEVAADRKAAELGYPLTAELTEWFKQHDPSERLWVYKRCPWLRTHPTWDQRLAAMRSA